MMNASRPRASSEPWGQGIVGGSVEQRREAHDDFAIKFGIGRKPTLARGLGTESVERLAEPEVEDRRRRRGDCVAS